MVIMIIGGLTFFSVFATFALHFGDFSNFESMGRSMAARGFGGMFMLMLGGFLMNVGRMGVAGSGIVLDPEEARHNVEPWARLTGGVVKDALDEAGINLGHHADGENLPFDERLRRLQKLREDGLINEQEFAATKQKILEEA